MRIGGRIVPGNLIRMNSRQETRWWQGVLKTSMHGIGPNLGFAHPHSPQPQIFGTPLTDPHSIMNQGKAHEPLKGRHPGEFPRYLKPLEASRVAAPTGVISSGLSGASDVLANPIAGYFASLV